MQCHQEAAELYEKCLQEVEGDKNALESIQLQKEWNERFLLTTSHSPTPIK